MDTHETVSALEITPADYQERFNRTMKDVELPFRAKFKVKHLTVADSVSARLNDHLLLMGTVDKETGLLSSVMLIGNGDGTVTSGANLMLVGVAALTAAVPNGTTKAVGPEVLSIMKAFDEEEGEPTSRILNGVKLWHMRNDKMGVFFGAEPA